MNENDFQFAWTLAVTLWVMSPLWLLLTSTFVERTFPKWFRVLFLLLAPVAIPLSFIIILIGTFIQIIYEVITE